VCHHTERLKNVLGRELAKGHAADAPVTNAWPLAVEPVFAVDVFLAGLEIQIFFA